MIAPLVMVDNSVACIQEERIIAAYWHMPSRPFCRKRGTRGSNLSINKKIKYMKWMHMVAWILVMVGAINWGLIGLGGFMGADWNIVGMILGSWPQVLWLVYILVGASAVYEIVMHKNLCKMCGSGGMM
jgi:uncharacterized membrane protein YuzA (DUF378 family)